MGLDGVVATSTTIDHDLGRAACPVRLLPRITEVARRLRRGLGRKPTIVALAAASPPVMDAELMLDAGADLLQIRPSSITVPWPGRINRALAAGSAIERLPEPQATG